MSVIVAWWVILPPDHSHLPLFHSLSVFLSICLSVCLPFLFPCVLLIHSLPHTHSTDSAYMHTPFLVALPCIQNHQDDANRLSVCSQQHPPSKTNRRDFRVWPKEYPEYKARAPRPKKPTTLQLPWSAQTHARTYTNLLDPLLL